MEQVSIHLFPVVAKFASSGARLPLYK